MPKAPLTDVAAGYSLTTTINDNNTVLEDAIDNTLSRDGTSPNQLEADIDMNSFNITNLKDGVNNQDGVTVYQLTNAIIGAGNSVFTSIESMTDVSLGTPTNKHVLIGDGTNWVGRRFIAGDIDAEASTDDFVLTSDGAGNAAWEAAQAGIADGTVTSAALKWNGSAWAEDTKVVFTEIGGGTHGQVTVQAGTANNSVGEAVFHANSIGSDQVFLLGAESTDDTDAFSIEWELSAADASEYVAFNWTTYGVSGVPLKFISDQVHLDDSTVVIGSGTVRTTERSAAPDHVASTGLWWTKNDTPSTPWFTDDAGGDNQLAYVGGAVTYTSRVATWSTGTSSTRSSGSTSTYNSGSITKFDDSAELTFGTGSDVTIDFDSANFVINGTGDAQFTGFNNLTCDSTIKADKFMQLRTETTANIANVAHAVNTDAGKVQGAMIWDSTANKMKVATGAADASTWVDADGTNAVTPA